MTNEEKLDRIRNRERNNGSAVWAKHKDGRKSYQATAPNEQPICCESNPTAMKPADRFSDNWKPGAIDCDKASGGCGTRWIPETP